MSLASRSETAPKELNLAEKPEATTAAELQVFVTYALRLFTVLNASIHSCDIVFNVGISLSSNSKIVSFSPAVDRHGWMISEKRMNVHNLFIF